MFAKFYRYIPALREGFDGKPGENVQDYLIWKTGRSDIVDGPLVFMRFDIFFLLCGFIRVTNIEIYKRKIGKGKVLES